MRYFDNDIFTCAGSPIHDIYKPIVKKDGVIELVVEGHENTDEIIQSFGESVDIDVIISRYMNGDVSALHQRIGQYGDFTSMPKSYAEMLQIQIDARNIFDSLSPGIRQKFDNDANQFFAQSGTKEWFEKMNVFFDQKEKVDDQVKEEVKE